MLVFSQRTTSLPIRQARHRYGRLLDSLTQSNQVSQFRSTFFSTSISHHITGNTNQDLRTEIKSLQYELSTLRQERDVVALQHGKEIADIQARADTDFRQAQVNVLVLEGRWNLSSPTLGLDAGDGAEQCHTEI